MEKAFLACIIKKGNSVSVARKIVQWFGYDLINTKHSHLRLEHHLSIVLRTLGINCVIDVGANKGQFGSLLRSVGYSGRIVSFEPLDFCYSVLKELARSDADWKIFPFALGGKACQLEMQQLKASELSSFLFPGEEARRRFTSEADVIQVKKVEVRRLDSLFHEIINGIREPQVYLKIDTQGFDLEVFRGAGDCVDALLGLQSEMSVVQLYEGMPDYLESLSVYRAAGFEVTGFYPIYRIKNEWIIGEFDCVMVKRGLNRKKRTDR